MPIAKNHRSRVLSEHNNSQPVLRTGPLVNVPATLRKLGFQPEPILQSAGFELAQFENPDVEISYVKGGLLLERCVEATGCDHFGFLLGTQTDPSTLGVPGFMLKVAPDVSTALHCLLQNLDLHEKGAVVSVETTGAISMLGYKLLVPGVRASEQVFDLSIVVAYKIMCVICGCNFKPTKVFISRPPPQNKADYERYFHAPVMFSADQNAVVFSTYWLHHKLPTSDPLLFKYFETKAAELRQNQSSDLIATLHQFIGRSLPDQTCSIVTSALHLNMHQRTLERRLRDRGTSFSHERDKIRFQIAQDLLSGGKTSNKQIALVLGYNDATAFIRSFKRWSGMSPARWRAHHTDL